MSAPESADAIVARVAAINPYWLRDAGSNHVCCFCGFFRDFRQANPEYGPFTHAETCTWVAARRHTDNRKEKG